jgi:molybdopterin synthase sulfur carrier subunit
MIKIDLNLFATLQKYKPEGADSFEVPDTIAVTELFAILNLPEELVKLVFINGRKQGFNYQLKNNDRVGIFPPVGGG